MTNSKPLALITGASRGIGAEIARNLAKNGYYVFINFLSNKEAASRVLNDIKKDGGTGELLPFAVSNYDAVKENFDYISKTHGTLSVLVNNAGITHNGLLIQLKNKDLEDVIHTNLIGTINCTKAAARGMIKAHGGSIIQISSVVAETGNPGQSIYAASKAGIIGFSKSIARELASRNVRVNIITPGFINTDMTESLTEAQKDAILRSTPLGFLGEPKDVAGLVAFLASSQSRYITGQVIGVNGGMNM